jgi:hypothetical protein
VGSGWHDEKGRWTTRGKRAAEPSSAAAAAATAAAATAATIVVECHLLLSPCHRQQQHYHQCTNGRTSVKTLTSPDDMDLF